MTSRSALMSELRSRSNSSGSVGSVSSGYRTQQSGNSSMSGMSGNSRMTSANTRMMPPSRSRYNGNGNSRSVRNRWPMLRSVQTPPRANASANSRPPMNANPASLNNLGRQVRSIRNKMSQNKTTLNQIYRNINSAKKAINNQYQPNITKLTQSIKQANANIKHLQKQGQTLTREANKARKMARSQQKTYERNLGFRPKSYSQRTRNFFGGFMRRSV